MDGARRSVGTAELHGARIETTPCCGRRFRKRASSYRAGARRVRNHEKSFDREEQIKMTSKVHLREVFEVEDGVLKSVDLSKLFFPDHGELRDAASTEGLSDQDVRLVRLQPKPANLSGTIRELLKSPQTTSTAIVPRGELTLTTVRTSHPASGVLPRVSLRPFPKAEPSPTIRPLPKATYSVKRSLDQSLLGGLLGAPARQERIEIELPFGAPRFVSAAT